MNCLYFSLLAVKPALLHLMECTKSQRTFIHSWQIHFLFHLLQQILSERTLEWILTIRIMGLNLSIGYKGVINLKDGGPS